MTPTMTPTITPTNELPAELRRIADGILFGRPSLVARQAADRLEELEHELAAERALADRLASAWTDSATWNRALPAYEAWKEARRE
jgi:hypothetical protein